MKKEHFEMSVKEYSKKTLIQLIRFNVRDCDDKINEIDAEIYKLEESKKFAKYEKSVWKKVLKLRKVIENERRV